MRAALAGSGYPAYADPPWRPRVSAGVPMGVGSVMTCSRPTRRRSFCAGVVISAPPTRHTWLGRAGGGLEEAARGAEPRSSRGLSCSRALEPDLHPVAPELVALALRDGRPFAVGAEERGRKVLGELRADLMTASGQLSRPPAGSSHDRQRAALTTASGQLSRPPAGSFVAVSGQSLVAAVRRPAGAGMDWTWVG